MAVYQRGKIWWCEFEYQGQRIRESTKQRTKSKALQWETNKRIEVMRQGVPIALRKAPLLSEAAKEFIDELEKSVAAKNHDADTLRDYRNGCRLLAAHDIWQMRINRITRSDAASLSFPGTASSARCAQRTLARVLNWSANEKKYIHAAPRIMRTRYKGRDVRIPAGMQDKLLAHMEGDCADIFQLLLDQFLRNADVFAMRWEDVHLDTLQPYYYVPRGKTEKARRKLPLSDRAIEILSARKRTTKSEWVFPTPAVIDPDTFEQAKALLAQGRSVRSVSMELNISWSLAKRIREGHRPDFPNTHRVTIWRQFEKARKAAGVEGVWLYDARRECATSFVEEGGDLATLQVSMGHADISTTNKYVHGDSMRSADTINKRNKGRLTLVEKRA